MNTRPLTFSAKAARLSAQKPWLTWSQVCSELSRRRRKPVTPPNTVTVSAEDRAAFDNVETPPATHEWMRRADLQ